MIIIGERVNATRKIIRTAIQDKDRSAIAAEIISQDRAGADYIDLNAGTGSGDTDQEKNDLCWLIDIALECTEKKLVLDAAGPEVLQHAASHLNNRRAWMLNSINGELEGSALAVIDLASEFQAPLIALAMDQDGIPSETERRIAICETITEAAERRGLDQELLFFDPLVLPVSTDVSQAMVTFKTIEGIKRRIPAAKTTLGLSNISYGLKKRTTINAAFLTVAICCGLFSAICDPDRGEIRRAIVLGELLAGRDRFCRKFSRAYREGLFGEA